MAVIKRDDTIIRIGDWNVHVSGDTVYVHHADHPGDISVQATPDFFKIAVRDDSAEVLKARLDVPYTDLGPMVGER